MAVLVWFWSGLQLANENFKNVHLEIALYIVYNIIMHTLIIQSRYIFSHWMMMSPVQAQAQT